MKKRIEFFQRKSFLIAIALLFHIICISQNQFAPIRLNQVGYYPNSTKLAIVTGKVAIEDFYIVTADGLDTVYEGALSLERKSSYSTTITRIADFTDFKKIGRYILRIEGINQSYPFEIKSDVYENLSKALLKGFYYQRSSDPLEEKYAGKWSRSDGHSQNILFIQPSVFTDDRGTVISTRGGWYDADDHNKYIVKNSVTVSILLSAYEDFSNHFDTLETNIPESDDNIPDLLNETLYNLRWMFSMQDPFDGGVYNKCTSTQVNGNAEISEAKKTLQSLTHKSTIAALDFAAVMAQAGRVFRKMNKQLPLLADSCLKASADAWYWALKNPNVEYDETGMDSNIKPIVKSGAENDQQFHDDWIWAATEMFVTSKNKIYFDVIEQTLKDSLSQPVWNTLKTLSYYTMLRYQGNMPDYSQDMIGFMQRQLLRTADNYIDHVPANAFATVMGQSKKDFIRGSNFIAANQGILLVNAYLLTGDRKYIDGAMSNLDYLLGRNATGFCFITGFGTQSPMHPHCHSTYDTTSAPVPGLLVGGPNIGKLDKCRYSSSSGPETSYTDSECAEASNEIALNWNAAMAYLVNAIEAVQYELGYSKK
ncbi:MAG TPA: glycoside hydrolase family 9 protein [Chitinophagaceae bacterium]